MTILARTFLAVGLLLVPPLISAASATPAPCATAACVRGAPGPIAGAGIPILVLGGLGAYWLFRRRRKAQ
jgi:hypothetical protein